jgi:putative intracellular protease/amidase
MEYMEMLMKKGFLTLALASVLAATSVAADAASVLVVLSDAGRLDLKDGKVLPTGFFFNELMQPVKLLIDAGHTVTFATPLGNAPTLDPASVDKEYFGEDVAALDAHLALLKRLKITDPGQSPVISLARVEQIGYEHFDALYIPGGRAPMQDLAHSPRLGKLLADFHARGKPTAMVCHGPIALLSALPDAENFVGRLESTGHGQSASDWIYAGYKMTVISNAEEELAKGRLGGEMKYFPQTALEQAGGNYSGTSPWAAHMVVDRELITGQNPASTLKVGTELLKRLK